MLGLVLLGWQTHTALFGSPPRSTRGNTLYHGAAGRSEEPQTVLTDPGRPFEARSAQLHQRGDAVTQRPEETESMGARLPAERAAVRSDRQPLPARALLGRVEGDAGRAAAAILEAAARAADLSAPEVWLQYVSIGGERSLEDVSDLLAGDLPLDAFNHNVLAVALNEHLMDRGFEPLLAYWDGSRRS